MPFSPEIIEEIIDRVANGEMLASVLKTDPRYPSLRYFYTLMDEDAELKSKYARVRVIQAEALAAEMMELSDNELKDVNDRKLSVGSRQWMMARLNPKQWGDSQRIQAEMSGPSGGPIESKITIVYEDAPGAGNAAEEA